MVDSLHDFKTKYSDINHMFMGMRRTDSPFAKNLTQISQTTPPYPQLTLINPILDWNITSVWYFLLKNSIQYCSLYDAGYTSLGNKNKTVKNQKLLVEIPEGESNLLDESFDGNDSGSVDHDSLETLNLYLPAFCLLNVAEERSNRT